MPKIIDQRIPKSESELTQIVLDTLRKEGLTWLEAIYLSSHPMQLPNWRILRTKGRAPEPQNPFAIVHHPAIVELGKKYALIGGTK